MKIETIVNQREDVVVHIGDFRGQPVMYLAQDRLLMINDILMQFKMKHEVMDITCIFGDLDQPQEFAQWLRHCFTFHTARLSGRFKPSTHVIKRIQKWERFK